MSAIHDVNKKVDLFSLGADDYVAKPFHNDITDKKNLVWIQAED